MSDQARSAKPRGESVEPRLELKGIGMQFPGVRALKGVSFDLLPGEVHALVGENGAGKSTLVKIITGILKPTEGTIRYLGEEVEWAHSSEAIRKGISAIYQEPAIFPDLNVAENIFMGHHPHGRVTGKIRWSEMYTRTRELLESLNSTIRPTDKLQALSIAEGQLVEIAKALSLNARIVIMDEPTSSLSSVESEQLFRIIRSLRESGTSILFISHRIEDIFEVADRVTALRDGDLIATRTISDVSKDDLIQMMVGRTVKSLFPKTTVPIGEEVLSVEGLSKKGQFSNVSFSLKQGEILGMYGLVGAGRTEVAKAIFGLNPPGAGTIRVDGTVVTIRSPNDAIARGLAYVPEDRDLEGVILNMSIAQNISLADLRQVVRAGLLDEQAEAELGARNAEMMQVKANDVDTMVLNLSGGNKQKVSLAKWIATKCRVLLFDEPTKGIDVATKSSVHKLIGDLAARGLGILLISSELPEIMGMSDNILVMHEGKVTGYLRRSEATDNEVLARAIS